METKSRSRVNIAFAVVVAGVVLVAVAAVALYRSAAPANSTTTQPCSTPVPHDPLLSQPTGSGIYNGHLVPDGSYRWLIFTVKPGDIATFCISVPLRQGSLNSSELQADALIVNATSTPPYGTEYSYSQAKNINTTFDPASLNLTSFRYSAGSLEVTYTMVADSKATGFYSLDYPGVCGLVALAVTDAPSTVSVADFPGFFMPSTCPLFAPFAGWSQMTGFSGMTATWVTGPPV